MYFEWDIQNKKKKKCWFRPVILFYAAQPDNSPISQNYHTDSFGILRVPMYFDNYFQAYSEMILHKLQL